MRLNAAESNGLMKRTTEPANTVSPHALTRGSTPETVSTDRFALKEIWRSKTSGAPVFVAGIDAGKLWLRGPDGQYRVEDPTFIAQYYEKEGTE